MTAPVQQGVSGFSPAPEPTIAELFGKLGEETSTLVRQEMLLAKAEMVEKAKTALRHTLLIGAGVLLALVSVLTLTSALVLGLSTLMEPWLAAVCVGVAFALLGFVAVQMGTSALKRMEPTPTKTIETLKENKAWAQELVR
jgi:uncharacterized membrane protein YqjE